MYSQQPIWSTLRTLNISRAIKKALMGQKTLTLTYSWFMVASNNNAIYIKEKRDDDGKNERTVGPFLLQKNETPDFFWKFSSSPFLIFSQDFQ
jgi:hypothetical protein